MSRLFATRRAVLGATLAAGTLAARPRAPGATVPEAATLLAPGPEGGPAADFAARAAGGLSRALVQAAALRVSVLGGPDGITAANRFATLAPPAEGPTMLAMPGLAAHALLAGDGRARFEPRSWPAVAGCLRPAVLAGRIAPGERRTLRVALPGPAAPEAAALLALELAGVPASAVFTGPGTTPEAAVAAGAADALVLTGARIAAGQAALGLVPLFAFDGAEGARDAALPEVPALREVLAGPASPELLEAVRAAGAALRVQGVLVLPALTSASAVAMWRDAARRWTEAEAGEVGDAARRVDAAAAVDALNTLCPAPEAMLAYRTWLQDRLDWRAA